MITLRAIVDDIRFDGSTGRYAAELTRALITTAPESCSVVGVIAAADGAARQRIEHQLPGLASLEVLTLPRRALQAQWAAGAGLLAGRRGAASAVGDAVGVGLLHSMSLFSPIPRRDRATGVQTVVTVHDATAWTHPKALSPIEVQWQRTMLRRAARHADAIVVPTHATGEELAAHVKLGDRVRVIAPGVSPGLTVGSDVGAAARAARLALPERYVLATGTRALSRGLGDVLTALASAASPGSVRLVVTGADAAQRAAIEQTIAAERIDPAQVRVFGRLDDADLAAVISRAAVFVDASVDDGLGLGVLEAMSFGIPVVHADAPALVELTAGAALVVPQGPRRDFPERLAMAYGSVLADAELASRMSVAGHDRSQAFSWRDSAEKVWQLHADL